MKQDVGKCRPWQRLVHSVESGVAGVELDGGQSGLTAGSSGISHGGSDSGGGSSQRGGGSGNGGHGSSNSGGGSVVQSGEPGVVEGGQTGDSGVVEGEASGGESGQVEAGSVGVGQGGDGGGGHHSSGLLLVSRAPLPLSVSGLQQGQVSGLGLGNLGGVLDGLGGDSGEDGSDQGLGVEGGGDQGLRVEGGGLQGGDLGGSEGSGADWEVGAGNSEAVDWVGNIVDSLEQTVSINVLVGASGHTIGIAGLKYQTELVAPVCSSDISQHLSTSRRAASMSERELSELILSVELGGRVDCPGVWQNLSTCSAYAGCENNLKVFHILVPLQSL